MTDKNQQLEERLQREYADLRQELFEKECALEEMRDSYEETLQVIIFFFFQAPKFKRSI